MYLYTASQTKSGYEVAYNRKEQLSDATGQQNLEKDK